MLPAPHSWSLVQSFLALRMDSTSALPQATKDTSAEARPKTNMARMTSAPNRDFLAYDRNTDHSTSYRVKSDLA
jgi:hypothetical protein